MEALKQILSLILWAALLFAQHVACFDVFNTNSWYLYLEAVVFAVGQHVLLYRNRSHRMRLCACGLAYSAVSVLKMPIILAMLFGDGWGLSHLCLALDLAGAAWSFRLAGTFRKKELL